jgi:hypothetical protein
MLLYLLACAPDEDSAEEVPFTSDTVVELSGTPRNECTDNELLLQIAFTVDVPEVVAEVHDGSGVVEFHDVPYAGRSEDDEEVRVHEKTLTTGANEADGSHTTFTCASPPYAGFRVYDEEGGLMACYFGEFVASEYDQTGCPES